MGGLNSLGTFGGVVYFHSGGQLKTLINTDLRGSTTMGFIMYQMFRAEINASIDFKRLEKPWIFGIGLSMGGG